MRPFVGTLIIEGEADSDGRVVATGALAWDTPVPIFDADRRRILGHAYGVERVDDEIFAVGSIDLPVGEYGVGADVVIDAQDIDDDSLIVRAGRLLAATITGEPSFARARIAVGRDRVDTRVERIVRDGVRDAYTTRDQED